MKAKKLLCLLIAACMTIVTFGGCTGIGGGGDDNSNKTEFKVGNLLSGYGDTWLKSLKEEFEKMYANYEFEDGKKGVNVVIDNRDQEFTEGALLSSMSEYKNDVYYVSDIYNQRAFVTQNLIFDTTEWVTTDIYDENGDIASYTGLPATQSILDTMYDGWEKHFNLGTETAPLYYGMPWRVSFGGIIYDADLFNKKALYFDDFGEVGSTASDSLGVGPDGKPNTSDDGMPETWGDFKILLEEMLVKGVTPFVWSGSLSYQRQAAFYHIVANYEGYDDFMLNFTFKGEDSDFGPIDDSNAYLLRGQQGKKAGLQAFKDIVAKPEYYHSSSFGSSDHKGAEKTFIESSYATDGTKPIAMLMEGGWWEQESREYADALALFNPELAYGMRNFRLLPIPRFEGVNGIDDQTNTENVLFGRGAHSMELVWAGSSKLNVARKWFEYVHSRDGLSIFTRDTSAFRPFNFTAKEERFAEFTQFTKSIYTYIEEGARLVYDLNVSNIRVNNAETFNQFITTFTGKNGITYYEPASAFRANSNWSVSDVFEAYKNSQFTQDGWGVYIQ